MKIYRTGIINSIKPLNTILFYIVISFSSIFLFSFFFIILYLLCINFQFNIAIKVAVIVIGFSFFCILSSFLFSFFNKYFARNIEDQYLKLLNGIFDIENRRLEKIKNMQEKIKNIETNSIKLSDTNTACNSELKELIDSFKSKFENLKFNKDYIDQAIQNIKGDNKLIDLLLEIVKIENKPENKEKIDYEIKTFLIEFNNEINNRQNSIR
jgi:hypothetical protein